ncbi:MAG: porin family protein [Ignavibacteriales bacterium]|nr:porin family protein [Ignavibacteriales bacterium]MCF8314787.1 porin family protein [Ignavibacteriales bacterium]MCF8436264.1 porin family protein [Ignavibacteriales bacterium]
MKTRVLFLSAFLILLSFNIKAQESRWAIELNSGVSMAAGKIIDADLNTGFGFEGVFHYRFMPHFGVYAGWGWNRFGADESFAGKDVCFEETGYVFGFQFLHPFGDSPFSYFLRAGGLYNHIETENSGGDIILDSGHGLGYQIAGGIEFPIGSNLYLSPGIKFNSLHRDIDLAGQGKTLEHNYFSLRVGISKKL